MKMLDRICSCLGKVFLAHISDETLVVSIYNYQQKHLRKNTDNFFKICDAYARLKGLAVSWYGLAECGNVSTALITVLLILQYETGEINVFTCSVIENSYQLVEIECLSLSDIFFHSHSNVFRLCDGPEIALIRGTKIHLYSLNHKKDVSYDLQGVLGRQVSHIDILQFYLIQYQDTINGSLTKYFLVIKVSNENSLLENIFFFCYIQNFSGASFLEEFVPIQNDYFFPLHFHSLVTAVIVQIPNENSVIFSENASLKERALQLCWNRNTAFVCTSRQCLVFSGGLMQYCCDIPYHDVVKIFLLPTVGPGTRNENIILQSLSKGICCIKKVDKMNRIQCVQNWKEAVKACKGCFLQNGSQQLLLLSNMSNESWQNNSVLIDFNTTCPTVSSTGSATSSDFLQNTFIGLQKRVLTGKAAVLELHCSISEKQAATKEVLQRLQGHCITQRYSIIDKDSLIFPFSLMDVLPLKYGNSIKQAIDDKKENIAFKIIGHWKAILSGRWILGWTLENISDGCIRNPKVKLLFSQNGVNLVQRLFVHPSAGMPCQPILTDSSLETDEVHPGNMVSLVACAGFPNFLTDVVNTSSVISWNLCINKEHENQHPFTRNEKMFIYQQITTEVSISVEDLLEKEPLQGLSVIQKLMSFRVLQKCTSLLILSAYSNLSTFEEILASNEQPNSPEFIKYFQMKYIIFSNSSSPLFGSHMSWNQKNKNSLEVSVYSRKEREATLFIQWLYRNLPDDIVIISNNTFHNKKKLLVKVKNEVDFLSEMLTSKKPDLSPFPSEANKNAVVESGQDHRGSFQNNTIVLSKDEFYMMRTALTTKELQTDNYIKSVLDCEN